MFQYISNFNSFQVSQVGKHTALSQSAYILFYSKTSNKDSGDNDHSKTGNLEKLKTKELNSAMKLKVEADNTEEQYSKKRKLNNGSANAIKGFVFGSGPTISNSSHDSKVDTKSIKEQTPVKSIRQLEKDILTRNHSIPTWDTTEAELQQKERDHLLKIERSEQLRIEQTRKREREWDKELDKGKVRKVRKKLIAKRNIGKKNRFQEIAENKK